MRYRRIRMCTVGLLCVITLVGCAGSAPGPQVTNSAPHPVASSQLTDTAAGAPSSPSAVPDLVEPVALSGTSYPLTITDFDGRTITLDKKPERIAVISGTPLNIFYDVGGTAVCGPDITENIRLVDTHAATIKALPSVGRSFAINMEALVAQRPDLVIAMGGAQRAQLPRIRELGIETMAVRVRTFAELATTYQLFGAINGTTDLARARMNQIIGQRDEVLAKWPDKPKSVVILYVTAQSLTVKLDSSIAGDMVKTLKIHNIASGLVPDNPGSETTPLDIEEIVRQQPDYVLVTSMISSNAQAKETIDTEFKRNSAWQAVDAVREQRVIYLPQQYFLFNAGPYYGDALRYLAASIYPDIYGAPVEPT